MNSSWPQISLGNLLKRVKDEVKIIDDVIYKQVTIRLWNKGVVLRSSTFGSEIKTKRQFKIRSGQLALSRIDVRNGAIGLVPQDLDGAIVSTDFWAYNIDQTEINPQFLALSVTTPAFWDKANRTSSGTTKRIRAEEEAFLRIEIPLPPLSEQRRIVAKIEQLAAKIEEVNRFRTDAEKESDVLLNSAISKVFSDIDSINLIPLASLTSKIGSGSTPPGGRATYPSSGIPFIRSLNVRMRDFQWDGIVYIDKATHETMKGTKVKPNDVLLNITGASIGRVACAPFDLIDANVNQHVTIIRPLELLNSRYLMYWLSQPSVQEFINNEQKGATRQGFTKAQIEQLKIPLCDLDEQRRIVAYLDGLQAQVDRLKALQAQTAAELEALLPSILDRAFKGEL